MCATTSCWSKSAITHLIHKRNYHYTADLLFDWFELSNFGYIEIDNIFTRLVAVSLLYDLGYCLAIFD